MPLLLFIDYAEATHKHTDIQKHDKGSENIKIQY